MLPRSAGGAGRCGRRHWQDPEARPGTERLLRMPLLTQRLRQLRARASETGFAEFIQAEVAEDLTPALAHLELKFRMLLCEPLLEMRQLCVLSLPYPRLYHAPRPLFPCR